MLRTLEKYVEKRFHLPSRQIVRVILIYIVIGLILGAVPLLLAYLGLWVPPL